MAKVSQLDIFSINLCSNTTQESLLKLYLDSYIARQQSSGLYFWLPLGILLRNLIADYLRDFNNAIGVEVQAAAIVPQSIYIKSGRSKIFGKEVFTFTNRKNVSICLAPTQEEIFASIMVYQGMSYKLLPRYFYQISQKYRDEIRPRGYILRSCDFLMKDGYSFTDSKENMNKIYEQLKECYINIFNYFNLKYIIKTADANSMLGSFSEEFIIEDCDGDSEYCDNDGNIRNGIEIGHIFKLSSVYTDASGVYLVDNNNQMQSIYMGSYGIGVDRLVYVLCKQMLNREIKSPSLFVFRYAFVIRNMNDELHELFECLSKRYKCLLNDQVYKNYKIRIAETEKFFANYIVYEENYKYYVNNIITNECSSMSIDEIKNI